MYVVMILGLGFRHTLVGPFADEASAKVWTGTHIFAHGETFLICALRNPEASW